VGNYITQLYRVVSWLENEEGSVFSDALVILSDILSLGCSTVHNFLTRLLLTLALHKLLCFLTYMLVCALIYSLLLSHFRS